MSFLLTNISIIEDSDLFSSFIVKSISNIGDVHVARFVSIEEFVNNHKEVPDIIVLDHYLDSENGIDNILKLRTIAPDSNILVLSGQKELSKMKEAVELGANDYLVKDGHSPLMVKTYIKQFIYKKEANINNRIN
jgi:two-component system chemotaxis response regulator CheY